MGPPLPTRPRAAVRRGGAAHVILILDLSSPSLACDAGSRNRWWCEALCARKHCSRCSRFSDLLSRVSCGARQRVQPNQALVAPDHLFSPTQLVGERACCPLLRPDLSLAAAHAGGDPARPARLPPPMLRCRRPRPRSSTSTSTSTHGEGHDKIVGCRRHENLSSHLPQLILHSYGSQYHGGRPGQDRVHCSRLYRTDL